MGKCVIRHKCVKRSVRISYQEMTFDEKRKLKLRDTDLLNEQYNEREIKQKNTEANKGLSPSEGSAGAAGCSAYKLHSRVSCPGHNRHPRVTQRRPTFRRQTEHAADI